MELYHIMNRGVDGRDVFLDTQDYSRFVHDLYEFNDSAPATEFFRATARHSNVGRATSSVRKQLVDVYAWVLMRNHYHLLIAERVEGGLTLFLRKMTGYARYFNDRHERRNKMLFERVKKVRIERQEQFLYSTHYMHFNPLDYLEGAKGWRERDKGDIRNTTEALAYLEKYRWSSYLDYCGTKNFPSLLSKERLFGSPQEYRASIKQYLSEREKLPDILTLERM